LSDGAGGGIDAARAAGAAPPASGTTPPTSGLRGTLAARGIRFRHHGASSDLFADFSLSLAAGEFAALIGPNGAGKTSLLRLLGGIAAPAAGEVSLGAASLAAMTARERARRIALVLPESSILFNFSVLEIVLMGRAPHLGLWRLEGPEDFGAARAALRDMDLAAHETRHLKELSSGERQRALVARALAQDPQVLLLDEPTAYLDLRHALEIFDILRRLNRERGLLVVTASHDLNLAARHASRLILLDRGRLAADGPPDEVLTPATIRDVYETEAEVARDPRTGAPYVIPRAPVGRR
jgi:iron complex transport system ATP-binding protein